MQIKICTKDNAVVCTNLDCIRCSEWFMSMRAILEENKRDPNELPLIHYNEATLRKILEWTSGYKGSLFKTTFYNSIHDLTKTNYELTAFDKEYLMKYETEWKELRKVAYELYIAPLVRVFDMAIAERNRGMENPIKQKVRKLKKYKMRQKRKKPKETEAILELNKLEAIEELNKNAKLVEIEKAEETEKLLEAVKVEEVEKVDKVKNTLKITPSAMLTSAEKKQLDTKLKALQILKQLQAAEEEAEKWKLIPSCLRKMQEREIAVRRAMQIAQLENEIQEMAFSNAMQKKSRKPAELLEQKIAMTKLISKHQQELLPKNAKPQIMEQILPQKQQQIKAKKEKEMPEDDKPASNALKRRARSKSAVRGENKAKVYTAVKIRSISSPPLKHRAPRSVENLNDPVLIRQPPVHNIYIPAEQASFDETLFKSQRIRQLKQHKSKPKMLQRANRILQRLQLQHEKEQTEGKPIPTFASHLLTAENLSMSEQNLKKIMLKDKKFAASSILQKWLQDHCIQQKIKEELLAPAGAHNTFLEAEKSLSKTTKSYRNKKRAEKATLEKADAAHKNLKKAAKILQARYSSEEIEERLESSSGARLKAGANHYTIEEHNHLLEKKENKNARKTLKRAAKMVKAIKRKRNSEAPLAAVGVEITAEEQKDAHNGNKRANKRHSKISEGRLTAGAEDATMFKDEMEKLKTRQQTETKIKKMRAKIKAQENQKKEQNTAETVVLTANNNKLEAQKTQRLSGTKREQRRKAKKIAYIEQAESDIAEIERRLKCAVLNFESLSKTAAAKKKPNSGRQKRKVKVVLEAQFHDESELSEIDEARATAATKMANKEQNEKSSETNNANHTETNVVHGNTAEEQMSLAQKWLQAQFHSKQLGIDMHSKHRTYKRLKDAEMTQKKFQKMLQEPNANTRYKTSDDTAEETKFPKKVQKLANERMQVKTSARVKMISDVKIRNN